MKNLVFLKLGGSLITEKSRPQTPRQDMLKRLAQEIADALQERPAMHLLVGHGSGSFGHVSARRYGTRQGVCTPEQWQGFSVVWRDAQALNRLVVDAFSAVGLAVISLPPAASVTASDGEVAAWDLTPLRSALQAGLLPLVFGDVVFDTVRGGTILSTEDLFTHLARQLNPDRILLAGIEAGVWADFPERRNLVPEITPETYAVWTERLAGSTAVDVTGGMASKVSQSLELVKGLPGLRVEIFSGEVPGNIRRALKGEPVGTQIYSNP